MAETRSRSLQVDRPLAHLAVLDYDHALVKVDGGVKMGWEKEHYLADLDRRPRAHLTSEVLVAEGHWV